jgi:hypothetical protein
MSNDRVYIAVGPQCCGEGATRKEAVTAMSKKWPRVIPSNGEFSVYSCPEGSKVTEHGGIDYPKDHPKPPFVVARGDASQRRGNR